MNLSPYRDGNYPYHRSRSSSVSSPSSRNFLYQEVFAVDGDALVRSYSCDHFFAKDKCGRTIQATQVKILNFVSPAKKLIKLEGEDDRKSRSVPKKLPVEYRDGEKLPRARMSLEFSEADERGESVAEADGSTAKKLTPLTWTNVKRTVCLNFVILSIFSACYVHRRMHCHQLWNTQNVVDKLRESVFGQEEAISKIENVLTGFHACSDSAVLCFAGSVGVGKTFVSTIIHENFPWGSNKYIDFFDGNTEDVLKTRRFSSCGVNLIVLDGISASDAEEALKIVRYLIDSYDGSKFFVILIFRTHHENGRQVLFEKSKYTDERFHYIPFGELNWNAVRECFNVELKRQSKVISEKRLNELLIEHMTFCNISKSFQGCKNVFHEVSHLHQNDGAKIVN